VRAGRKVKHLIRNYQVLPFDVHILFVYGFFALEVPVDLPGQSLFGPLPSGRFCVVFHHPSIDSSPLPSR
jgi:hypothetical protein